MILKAAQRSGAKALATHLLNAQDNEFVEVHEVRGFISDDVTGAFKEVQAIAKGTKCRQPFFSVSFNPPANVSVDIPAFGDAIERVEQAAGLQGQPRVVIFHEKDGRRHAHAVWSRIDAQTMTAKNMPFYKNRLMAVSRELFFDHGWKMPRGLMDRSQTSPTNVTLAEWQSAKRRGRSAIDQKALIRQCWSISDCVVSFSAALAEHGYRLAQGDRRSHVVVAPDGEVIAVARATGIKTKLVRERLGPLDNMPSVAQAMAEHAHAVRATLSRMAGEVRGDLQRKRAALSEQARSLIQRHKAERHRLDAGQADRWAQEAAARRARLQSGLRGLWHRLTGQRTRIEARNAREALAALERDRAQRQTLIDAQLGERRTLEVERTQIRRELFGLVRELKSDRDRIIEKLTTPQAAPTRRRQNRPTRGHRHHDGPDLSL